RQDLAPGTGGGEPRHRRPVLRPRRQLALHGAGGEPAGDCPRPAGAAGLDVPLPHGAYPGGSPGRWIRGGTATRNGELRPRRAVPAPPAAPGPPPPAAARASLLKGRDSL